ncbi:DUF3843 family protein [Verrucomicrobiota bacterium]
MRNTRDFRPPGPPGKGDKYLREVAREVERTIRSALRNFEFETLRLTPEELSELSHVLAGFAEDLHNDIGIWRTYENYNREWFGVCLPITEGSDQVSASAISADRVRHLLWVVYSELKPELVLGPMQRDLGRLAEVVAEALAARIAPVPRDSGVKRFLETPNEHGWDIKRKLVWMGTRSYLFRTACRQYLVDQEADVDDDKIGPTDDFICQECTQWSGLGVLDVLAALLPLTEEDRKVLRGWYERHAALYRIDSAGTEVLEVTNLINERLYRVMMGRGPQPFRTGSMVFGSLVPWGEYWYWSGSQRQYPTMDDAAVQDVRQSMIAKSPSIIYRYRKDLLDQAVAATERHHQEFLDYHGGRDLVVYPDGLSMAADEQRRFKQMYEAQSRKTVDRVMAKLGLKNPWPNMTYPEHILNCTTGIGLYYDPGQGVEMMTGFNDVLEGFAKQGRDLSDDDAGAIRACIMSHSISPSFVRRIVRQHGDASIHAAFLLHGCDKPYTTEHLLRRYKGAAFRNVYPNMSVVE